MCSHISSLNTADVLCPLTRPLYLLLSPSLYLSVFLAHSFMCSHINSLNMADVLCPLTRPLCLLVSPSLYLLVFLAHSFMCSHISFLNSFSVRATSSLSLKSISANSVANVRPVSSAFFVPFCIDTTVPPVRLYLNYLADSTD